MHMLACQWRNHHDATVTLWLWESLSLHLSWHLFLSLIPIYFLAALKKMKKAKGSGNKEPELFGCWAAEWQKSVWGLTPSLPELCGPIVAERRCQKCEQCQWAQCWFKWAIQGMEAVKIKGLSLIHTVIGHNLLFCCILQEWLRFFALWN